LAVVLGVILGLGMTIVPSSIDSGKRMTPMQLAAGTQYKFEAGPSPLTQLQSILIGLLVGLVLAVPVFLLVKHRS
jgi:ABC-type antimicrobial peptide transport system permease subunit